MDDVDAGRAALVTWFESHRRDLPWRRTRDPYAIWVSEVMLQQTRVDTVVPYYERFLRRFPDPRTLAEADPEDVRAAWSGLGYYRRARQLQSAARTVVERFGGALPAEPDALAELPGFGPYTVGAVASFAFDRAVPALDGNVKRVLARLHGVEGDLDRAATRRRLDEVARRWVEAPRPGRTNEALMELGATVCAPRNPSCSSCPLATGCRARAEGRVSAIPPPKRRPAPRRQPWTAHCAWTEDAVFLEPRPPGIFAGLWCLPMMEGHPEAPPSELVARAGGTKAPPEERARVEHVLSHRRLVVRVWGGAAAAGAPNGSGRWVPLEGLAELGLPTFTAKLLQAALPAAHRRRLRWTGRRASEPRPHVEPPSDGSP